MKNPSLYFDNVEMFMRTHPDNAPLAMLMAAVRSSGCPENMIDEVVNGAIAKELNLTITPKEQTVKVYEDGFELESQKLYNPSYEDLINFVVSRFVGIDTLRAKAIVDALISKHALTIYDDGMVYRTMVLLPRQLLAL